MGQRKVRSSVPSFPGSSDQSFAVLSSLHVSATRPAASVAMCLIVAVCIPASMRRKGFADGSAAMSDPARASEIRSEYFMARDRSLEARRTSQKKCGS